MSPCRGETSPPPVVAKCRVSLENAHGGETIHKADVGLWLRRATRCGRASLFIQRKVIGFHAELGEHVFQRNALSAALGKPGLPFMKPATGSTSSS